LRGRRIPAVCRDFEEKGVDLSALYEGIDIPLSLLDERALREQWTDCYRRRMSRYGLSRDIPRPDEVFDGLIRERGAVDFGVLSDLLQREVITRLIEDGRARSVVLDGNPLLTNISHFSPDPDVIERNRNVVLTAYSPGSYGERMREVYGDVMGREVRHSIHREVILRAFNQPAMNHLLLCDTLYE
jgi:hypothetical protein